MPTSLSCVVRFGMQAGSPGSLWNATLDQGEGLVCSTVDFLMRKANGISSHSLTEKKKEKQEKKPQPNQKPDLLIFCWEIGNSCHESYLCLIPTVRNRNCSVASYNFYVSNKTGDPLYCIRLAFIKRFKINNYKRISYKLPTTLWHRLLNYQRVCVCVSVLVRVHVPLFPVGEEVIKL